MAKNEIAKLWSLIIWMLGSSTDDWFDEKFPKRNIFDGIYSKIPSSTLGRTSEKSQVSI